MRTASLRVALASAFGLLSLTVLSAARAWPCVPQPFVTVAPRASGSPGTEVTVEGTGFDSGPAEIRWNAVDGPRLASTNGPNFSLSVAIPNAPPGLYLLVVLSRGADGGVTQKASSSFDVREDANTNPATPPRSEAPPPGGPGSSEVDGSSPVATVAGIALAGLALAILGGVVGAKVSSRLRTPPSSLTKQ